MLSKLREKMPMTFWNVPIMAKAVVMVMFSLVGVGLISMSLHYWLVDPPDAWPFPWVVQPGRDILAMTLFFLAYLCFHGGFLFAKDMGKPCC